jgi:hypothetical protein
MNLIDRLYAMRGDGPIAAEAAQRIAVLEARLDVCRRIFIDCYEDHEQARAIDAVLAGGQP